MVRVPGWARYPWLRAGFSTRWGGVSFVYGEDGLNLGWTREDDPAAVVENRARFVEDVGPGSRSELVTVGQVHGATVRDLERERRPWTGADGRPLMEGDGLISYTPGRLLAILTADCVPVLVADTRLRAVGAFHAGWRGTLARVAEGGVTAMIERYGSRPEDLTAAIGPCIGACCFAVGGEVREAFLREFTEAESLFSDGEGSSDVLRMDLGEANRRQLAHLGIGNVWVSGECTACARSGEGQRKFFSHRGERGVTGRMLGAIGAVE